jgi:hypothetical protein
MVRMYVVLGGCNNFSACICLDVLPSSADQRCLCSMPANKCPLLAPCSSQPTHLCMHSLPTLCIVCVGWLCIKLSTAKAYSCPTFLS